MLLLSPLYAVESKSENVSFLIHCTEDGLVQAQAKDGGTTRWHMVSFFKSMQEYLKNNTNIPLDSYIHIIDNSPVTRNEIFFDYV